MLLIWTPNKEYTGDTVKIVAETDDLETPIAYVQKLGMNRGKWRDLFEPQGIEVTDVTLPRSAEWIDYGKAVYEARCVGCHGEKRRRSAGCDLPVEPTPAELQRRRVQVQAEPEAGAD